MQLVDFYNSITTLAIGIIAYLVYLSQKKDHKRDAASIILIELENAERQLQIILGSTSGGEQQLPQNILVMPNNSWNRYKYLFVKNFDQNEWDKITEFYSRCLRYDSAVEYNGSFFSDDVKQWRINVHANIAAIAKELASKLKTDPNEEASEEDKETIKKYLDIRRRFENIYENDRYFYNPLKPINDATEALKSMETNLSLTSIGTKLKKLSRVGFLARLKSVVSSTGS